MNEHAHITMRAERIEVHGHLQSREDVERLVGWIRVAADAVWPCAARAEISEEERPVAQRGAQREDRAGAQHDDPADATKSPAPEPAAASLPLPAPEPEPEPEPDDARPVGVSADVPLVAAEILARPLPLDEDLLEQIVAEKLTDQEFEALTCALSEAVALRRCGLKVADVGRALGATESAVSARLVEAKKRGVVA